LRDEPEFSFGGSPQIRPPSASDAEWSRYLFERENPKGLHLERWVHSYGCGRWFNVVRDTVSHHIVAVYLMGDAAPGVPDPAEHP
jgi:heterotetrameric sarcosine oxidase delta subunit